MAYKEPDVLAQNSKQGTFAAGCPEKIGKCNSHCEIRR